MIQPAIPSATKKASIGLILLCTLFQIVPIGAMSLFLPRIRADLDLSFTQAGSLSAVVMLIYGAMQVPAGYLADRLSPRRLFFIGAIGTTVLTVAFGLCQHYWQAMTVQVALGFVNSFMFLPGAVLMMMLFPPGRRASAVSMMLMGTYVGQVVFNLAAPAIAPGGAWRPVFLYFGSAGVIAALLYFFFAGDVRHAEGSRPISRRDFIKVLKNGFMWLCNGLQFIRLAVYFGITAWVPAYLMVEHGLPLQTTGLIVVGMFAMIAAGTMLAGMVADRWRRPAAVVIVALSVLLITLLLLAFVQDVTLIIIVLMINAFFLASTSGPLYAMPIERLGGTAQGTVSGVGNLAGNTGAFVFTFLLGALKDATGLFQSGFLAMAAACLAGLVLAVLAAVSRQKHLKSCNAA